MHCVHGSTATVSKASIDPYIYGINKSRTFGPGGGGPNANYACMQDKTKEMMSADSFAFFEFKKVLSLK